MCFCDGVDVDADVDVDVVDDEGGSLLVVVLSLSGNAPLSQEAIPMALVARL